MTRDEFVCGRRQQIHIFVSRMTRGAADAEDLTQDALLKAWRSWDTFRGDERARLGWLYTIARNVCNDWHRRQKKWVGPSFDDPDAWLAEPRAPQSVADDASARADVDRLLADLPPRHQALLRMTAAGWMTKDVADVVGMSHVAVRAQLHRTRLRLRAVA